MLELLHFNKIFAIFTSQELRCTQLSQDLNKHKEEVNSVGIKLKWTQNKLKTEGEAHKVCGGNVSCENK